MTAEMVTALGALMLAIATLVSAILLNRKTMALLEYRLGQVEQAEKDKDNHIKRLEEIEKAIIAIQKDIEFIKNKP